MNVLLMCGAFLALRECHLPPDHRLVPVQLVRVSWFDPSLGGINCDHECSRLGDGSPVETMYDRALACPPGWYGRWLFIPKVGWRECRDGGGAIVVDVLTRTPIDTSTRVGYRLVRWRPEFEPEAPRARGTRQR